MMSVAACQKDTGASLVGSWGQQRVSQENKVTETSNFKFAASDKGGEGVDLYVVDTGIHITHEDFTHKLKGTTTYPYAAPGTGEKWDRNGHGTHVASTSGGITYGVAKNANLIAVKVLGDSGSGSNAGVISGVDFVVQQHDRSQNKKSVANMSLGGSKSAALDAAVENAISKGVVFVVAAGNSNLNACNYSPSGVPDAITVGSTAQTDDVRSTFSNYGRCVDVFGPGTSIKAAWWTSNTATNTISGTSMASPHVAGVAALILGDVTSGTKTPKQVKDDIDKGDYSIAGKIILNCPSGSAGDSCRESPNRLVNTACQN
jgi:serine protease